ncbi:MAG: Hsp20/alpha crystallin family protein [Campylobacterota bacterium]|nr:Hsp20/alpha crystallin family protein [Campylobacterota bacterium]
MFRKKISLFILPFMTMVSLQANDPFYNDPFGDDIFKEMYQMQKEMDKVFERMQQRMEQRSQLLHYPTRERFLSHKNMKRSTLLVDKGSYYEYNTQIPENKSNQIDVNIEEGILRIQATINRVKESQQPNMQMQQRSMQMIQRSETLPLDADVSTLKGEYLQGVFVLTLQKKKGLSHTAGTKQKKTSQPASKTEKVKEKNESNRTKIRVPHTSSHI